MSVIVGKDVAVNGVPNGGVVEIEDRSDSEAIYHSSGAGGAERAEGNVDYEGSYLAWGHTPLLGESTLFCNDKFALAYTLGTTGSGQGANVRCIGLDIVVPTYDPTGRSGVYHKVYFGADGEDLAAASAAAGAAAAIINSKGLACTFDGSRLTNVVSMLWRFRVNVQGEPDSSSGGIYQRPAGNIDWQFMVRRHITSWASVPAKNATGALAMEVEASGSSYLEWTASQGRVIQRKGIFDPQSRELVGVDIVIGKCTNSGVVGTINSPSEQVWP